MSAECTCWHLRTQAWPIQEENEMTKRIGIGLFMFAVAGCGDSTATMTDLATAPDLAVTGTPDLTVVKDMANSPDTAMIPDFLVTGDMSMGAPTVLNATLT